MTNANFLDVDAVRAQFPILARTAMVTRWCTWTLVRHRNAQKWSGAPRRILS